MPIIINEDKALKAMLTGVTVSDSGNPARPVGVWFGQPDVEIRQQSFPYITIDFLGYSEDTTRAHRGMIDMPYRPEGFEDNNEAGYLTEYPIPVNLDYQITTWARQPRHDRQIMAEMLSGQRLPLRFGLIIVPEDNTVRRLDFLGHAKRDTIDGNQKRLFSNVYTVRISAEVLPAVLEQKILVTDPPYISVSHSQTPFTELDL
jgi:hypothetical protein